MGREGVFFKGSILVETSTGLPQGSQEAEQLTLCGGGTDSLSHLPIFPLGFLAVKSTALTGHLGPLSGKGTDRDLHGQGPWGRGLGARRHSGRRWQEGFSLTCWKVELGPGS